MPNKRANEFPNLLKMGRNWKIESFFKSLRYPETWVHWLAVVAAFALIGKDMIGWGFGILFIGVAGAAVLQNLRLAREGAGRGFAAVGAMCRASLRRNVALLARSGKLVDRIGREGADQLERCSGLYLSGNVDLFRLLTTGVERGSETYALIKQAIEAAQACMQGLLICYERPLIWRQSPSGNDLERAAQLEAGLKNLADDASAWADAVLTYRPAPQTSVIRARLEAIKELGPPPEVDPLGVRKRRDE